MASRRSPGPFEGRSCNVHMKTPHLPRTVHSTHTSNALYTQPTDQSQGWRHDDGPCFPPRSAGWRPWSSWPSLWPCIKQQEQEQEQWWMHAAAASLPPSSRPRPLPLPLAGASTRGCGGGCSAATRARTAAAVGAAAVKRVASKRRIARYVVARARSHARFARARASTKRMAPCLNGTSA